MKKPTAKLRLDRETLKQLTTASLADAAGGGRGTTNQLNKCPPPTESCRTVSDR